MIDRSIDKLAPENQSFIFNLLLTNNQDILLIRVARKNYFFLNNQNRILSPQKRYFWETLKSIFYDFLFIFDRSIGRSLGRWLGRSKETHRMKLLSHTTLFSFGILIKISTCLNAKCKWLVL